MRNGGGIGRDGMPMPGFNLPANLKPIMGDLTPKYGGYGEILNSQGTLPGQYQLSANEDAISRIRQQAMGGGNDVWGQMMKDRLATGRASDEANLINRAGSQGQTAQRNMAMRGGLRSSDVAAINQEVGRSQAFGLQDIGRRNKMASADIDSQVAQTQEASMKALPGMELQALKPKEFNIQKSLQEKRQQEAAKLAKFQTEMQTWAAGKQAGATAASGKK